MYYHLFMLLNDSSSITPSVKNIHNLSELSTEQVKAIMFSRADHLRKNPTHAELKMIKILRSLKFKFTFQAPRWRKNCFRILDFWLPRPISLRIEVDGPIHDSYKDEIKDYYYRKTRRKSMRTIRFTNDDVLLNPETTKLKLQELINPRTAVRM